jgi:hypothetical protein
MILERQVYTFNTTEEDIRRGQVRNPGHCPNSVSIVREMAKYGLIAKAPHVNKDTIRFTVGEFRYVFQTPKALAEWIEQADDEGRVEPMEPISFRLDFSLSRIHPKRQLSPSRIGNPPSPMLPEAKIRRKLGVDVWASPNVP